MSQNIISTSYAGYPKSLLRRTAEVSARVALCGERAIEIAGQVLRPDASTAYVEFYLSHAFPVVTVDDTALHPQVVANSYRSMLYKVFDLAHLMKKYDPKNNPRDRILGTVVAVEFPPTPEGGWKVQGDKDKAPGIRAVACMHKNAEQVNKILDGYFSGQMQWTVSMEQAFTVESSGFLIKGDYQAEEEDSTPEDLKALGWQYVSAAEAPNELLKCLDSKEAKIIKKFRAGETLVLFGGLNGSIHYQGVGLTPLGKEKEAEVSTMLASAKLIEGANGELMPDVVELLKKTAALSASLQTET
jgi:hypothetical protein